ncbi:MAG: hypothetical protein WBC70_18175 [Candidatus Aminicenantales bacterium]
MDESIEEEIRRLKNGLLKKKTEVENIRALVNREIDRDFQPEALDLTARELEPFIEKTLAEIEKNLILKTEQPELKSHRKIFGRPVLFFKRTFMTWADIFFKPILDRQNRHNRNSFDLLKVLLLRSRWSIERLKDLEGRLGECEENLVVMISRVEDLQARPEREIEPAAKK